MLNVFIGYDRREPKAFEACVNSIHAHTTNFSITPIVQDEVRAAGLYTRAPDARAATEFSLTRFLVPWLAPSGSSVALFCDCDFIFTSSLHELVANAISAAPGMACWVVKHDSEALWDRAGAQPMVYQSGSVDLPETGYPTPEVSVKMHGVPNERYPRKWWSALVLWNLNHPATHVLTVRDVNTKEPSWLHRFSWLPDFMLGDLPADWHWLDGYSDAVPYVPRGIHLTRGTPEHGPMWSETRYANLWRSYLDRKP